MLLVCFGLLIFTTNEGTFDGMAYAVKSFVLVGYNDQANKLAYCYFYDFDIDALAWSREDPLTAMHEFMDGSFYWNDIA